MRYLFILLTVLTFNNQFACGQEFSFQLYFENVLGFMDTLVFDYDNSASDTIDASFGEVNIISTLFDAILETRISDFDFWTMDQYILDLTTFHTKTQI